jgi:hypothetical protein
MLHFGNNVLCIVAKRLWELRHLHSLMITTTSLAIQAAVALEVKKICLVGDSELVIKQLQGSYRLGC